MPRPTNFVAFIRNVVREQVQQAIQGLLGAPAAPRKKAGIISLKDEELRG